jgi:TPR repeat protein
MRPENRYAHGWGVSEDQVKAGFWYGLAAKVGYKRAEAEHAKLRKQMTVEEISEVERLMAEWQPKDCTAEGIASPTVASMNSTKAGEQNRLTGEEVQKLFSRKTHVGVGGRGWKFSVFFGANGKASGKARKGINTSKDKGRWWVEENTICTKYPNWLEGKQRCSFIVEENGEYLWVLPDGSDNGVTQEILDGNPRNL